MGLHDRGRIGQISAAEFSRAQARVCADLAWCRLSGMSSSQQVPGQAESHGAVPLERRTYTVREAAQILGVGRNAVYELVRTGRLGALRLGAEGHRIVVPRDAVERLLAESAGG
jgi:excisionase family DNA binding protein